MRAESFLQAHRTWVGVVSAVLPLVACAALAPFRESVANTDVALALVLLIVAAASTGVRWAGVVAAVSSAVWFDFFLTRPYHQLTIANREDVETAVLLVIVGVAVSEIAHWGRRQQARASRQEGYLSGVVRTSAAVAAGRESPDTLTSHVADQITDVLRIDDCRFDRTGAGSSNGDHGGGGGDGDGDGLPTMDSDGHVTRRGRPLDVDRYGLPTDAETALVVRSGGVVHGRFLLVAATEVVHPTLEQRQVAATLASQLGAALSKPGAQS
ncbi:protein of unknown function [Actinopolymorpha cephalotaxi]|uniref:Sensor protein KdpD transmembrane domain-containing protein n=1 Tax=Actinopolymorpha cephalotaxi TaxID=504797 RepID=A0A1I2LWD4_9ACTN|nr:DUF4118 domain-containing protein [Actinopolymorpha cephalotaxi]NYH81395.1 hypothetical protein [Actinopolymorpha cephalotaxi]SFF81291.1 protein of unknown function [Actinopolymorpha cephalotaxi]